MLSRKYVSALCAGLAIGILVYLVDALLARLGLHAETTYLDDALIGIAVAVLVLLLQWQYERELLRQRRCIAVIELMNHHIRNALQVIVSRATLGREGDQLRDINLAVERIDRALSEILPSIKEDVPDDRLAEYKVSMPQNRSHASGLRG